MSKISPCPICGNSENEFVSTMTERKGDTIKDRVYFIYCFACLHSGEFYDTKESAIEAWNDEYNHHIPAILT